MSPTLSRLYSFRMRLRVGRRLLTLWHSLRTTRSRGSQLPRSKAMSVIGKGYTRLSLGLDNQTLNHWYTQIAIANRNRALTMMNHAPETQDGIALNRMKKKTSEPAVLTTSSRCADL